MATLASQIPITVQNCNEILNSGAAIYVSLLENCAKEPTLDTITVDTTPVATGDESVNLVSDDADGTFLRAGSILTFSPSDESVVILNDVTVTTTPALVEIEEYTGTGIPASETTQKWGMRKLLSPVNIPFSLEATTVSRDDLSSFQTSSVKTKNSFNPSVECIAAKDDTALWTIFDAARTVNDLYVVIVYPSDQLVFGRALVEGFSSDISEGEIMRPSFSLSFQGDDYRMTQVYSQASVAEQAVINEVLQYTGEAVFA